jgi:DNA-binding GntR family transcriptional regulator
VAAPPAALTDTAMGDEITTATQRVYDGVYTAILERRLAPGTWLRETELAASFAVSRTVVRQALHRLGQDQVVEQHHNRGARVPEPQRELARHVFDARRVIECEVAKQLAGHLSRRQVAQLRRLVDAEAKAVAQGNRPAAIRLSGEFHRVLAQMGGNPVFLRLIEGMLPTTSLLMALYQPNGHPGCVAHRHEELIEALQEGGARAVTEMRRHLAELEQSISG